MNNDHITINSKILQSLFDLLLCPGCGEKLQITNDLGMTTGFFVINKIYLMLLKIGVKVNTLLNMYRKKMHQLTMGPFK